LLKNRVIKGNNWTEEHHDGDRKTEKEAKKKGVFLSKGMKERSCEAGRGKSWEGFNPSIDPLLDWVIRNNTKVQHGKREVKGLGQIGLILDVASNRGVNTLRDLRRQRGRERLCQRWRRKKGLNLFESTRSIEVQERKTRGVLANPASSMENREGAFQRKKRQRENRQRH